MIKKLRFKFIVLAMTTIILLLSVIVMGMNMLNYKSVVSQSDEILSVISHNRGFFPEFKDKPFVPKYNHITPETPYESRYFSVFLTSSGDVFEVKTDRISSVDKEAAAELAISVLNKNEKGFVDRFRYNVIKENDETRIFFLDCSRLLGSYYDFLYTSLFMTVIGLILAFIVITILSGKIIKPISESYEKQKQFITNAGHELKTPLTIINANTDILEMELDEENESLADIKAQVKRLRSLTDNLVMLTRMEEAEKNIVKIDFPVSEVVAETAKPFFTLAEAQNKELVCNIQPNLTLNGNSKAIEQLVSLLLDNAVKYSPECGKIILSLEKQNRNIVLSVLNPTEYEVTDEQLDRAFDRFYRAESSHNSETGGHGIGLSVAKAIAISHGGKISVTSPEKNIFLCSCFF